MEHILVQRDLLNGWDCGREDCVVCIHKPQENTKTNYSSELFTYRALCLRFKNSSQDNETIGVRNKVETASKAEGNVDAGVMESCKSLYNRGLKHEENYWLFNTESIILRHHMNDERPSRTVA